MISALLSPKGTLDPSGFIKSGMLLIFLGFAIIGAGIYLPMDGRPFFWISFLLAIPWIFIWIKRLRFGGASPALILAYLALYAFLLFVVLLVSVLFFSGGNFMELVGEYSRQEITMEEYQAGLQDNMDPATMLRNMFASGLIASLATLFIGNMATPKNVKTD